MNQYKELRSLLREMLGKPDFCDNIKYGVSFKWYLDNIKYNTSREFIENLRINILKYIPNHFRYSFDITVKLQPEYDDYGVLNRNRSKNIDTVRILVRRWSFQNEN